MKKMSKIEWCDPYERHKKCVYTWLLCWKRIRKKKSIHEKQIGVKIAKLLSINFKYAQKENYRLKNDKEEYYWIDHDSDTLKPCPECFLPLFRFGIFDEPGLCGKCSKNHRYSIKDLYDLPQCCGHEAFICSSCALSLAQKNNWLLPEDNSAIGHVNKTELYRRTLQTRKYFACGKFSRVLAEK